MTEGAWALTSPVHLVSVNTSVPCEGTVHHPCQSPLEKVVSGTVNVCSDTVQMRCGSSRAQGHINHVQTRKCMAVVFDQPALLNQNMAVHCRWLLWVKGLQLKITSTVIKRILPYMDVFYSGAEML